MRQMWKSWLLLLPLLASCALLHPYSRPDAAAPNLYRGSISTTDTTSAALQPWRTIFTDAPLQKLLEEGLNQNLDLRIAVTRIQRAEANLAQSRAAFLPSLSARASATEARVSNSNTGVGTTTGSGTTGTGTGTTTDPSSVVTSRFSQQYLLTLSSSWQADGWGKLRSTKRSYVAALLQS